MLNIDNNYNCNNNNNNQRNHHHHQNDSSRNWAPIVQCSPASGSMTLGREQQQHRVSQCLAFRAALSVGPTQSAPSPHAHRTSWRSATSAAAAFRQDLLTALALGASWPASRGARLKQKLAYFRPRQECRQLQHSEGEQVVALLHRAHEGRLCMTTSGPLQG